MRMSCAPWRCLWAWWTTRCSPTTRPGPDCARSGDASDGEAAATLLRAWDLKEGGASGEQRALLVQDTGVDDRHSPASSHDLTQHGVCPADRNGMQIFDVQGDGGRRRGLDRRHEGGPGGFIDDRRDDASVDTPEGVCHIRRRRPGHFCLPILCREELPSTWTLGIRGWHVRLSLLGRSVVTARILP